MEIGNQDKRPEVWVVRKLMRKDCGIVGYFSSKARVQNVNRRFLRNGQDFKEYSIEYETPKELEDLNRDSDLYVETGDWVMVDRVFRTYSSCRDYVETLNKELLRELLTNSISAYEDGVKDQHYADVKFAKKLENYFNKLHIIIILLEK